MSAEHSCARATTRKNAKNKTPPYIGFRNSAETRRPAIRHPVPRNNYPSCRPMGLKLLPSLEIPCCTTVIMAIRAREGPTL